MRAHNFFAIVVLGTTTVFCVPRPLVSTSSSLSSELLPRNSYVHPASPKAKKHETPQVANVITWYSGESLKDPACGVKEPKDSDKIAAVPESWGLGWCGKDIALQKGEKSVVVRVVDLCGSCKNESHFDLSKGAFKQLADLNEGELHDVTWSVNEASSTTVTTKLKTHGHQKRHRRRLDSNVIHIS